MSRTVITDSVDPFKHDPSAKEPIRVLVISDELITRAGLRHLLEASGVVVIAETRASDEAIRIVKQDHPHIALVDADSCAGAAIFCDELTAENVRVIVLSERTHTVAQRTWLEIGAMGLVMKDDAPAVLIKAIGKVHQGEAWLDRAKTAEVIAHVSRRKRVEDAEQMKIASLTAREREIIVLLGEGLKNDLIAERLFISQATVRNHLTSILDKLDVSNRFELAVYAFRHRLVHYRLST